MIDFVRLYKYVAVKLHFTNFLSKYCEKIMKIKTLTKNLSRVKSMKDILVEPINVIYAINYILKHILKKEVNII